MSKVYDFSGYATKNDLKCSDGRTIRKNAFKDCDGKTVPLVWQHIHDDPGNVIGHALLENRSDGVYCYGSLNATERGQQAKELLAHGDINSLSIYANKLIEKGGDVLHGAIREVSLVLTGANPGALIDNLTICHSDDTMSTLDDEAIIYSPCDTLSHSEGDTIMHKYTDEEVFDILVDAVLTGKEVPDGIKEAYENMSEENQDIINEAVGITMTAAGITDFDDEDDDDDEDENEKDSDNDGDDGDDGDSGESSEGGEAAHSGLSEDATIGEIFETFTDQQKEAVYALLALASKENNIEHGGIDMKTNVFDNYGELAHSELDFNEVVDDARRCGSFAEAFLAHADEVTYGIDGISNFKPDAQLLSKEPDLYKRGTEWVDKVLNAVHRSPFSRVKSMYANITADEARAKGYVTGNQKVSEVITALKRTTSPTTIYKLQKLDRDDILDITDFDVVAWIKKEMRIMLDEEIARAILIGDGRSDADQDKISELNIRPIYSDDATYTYKTSYEEPVDATNKQIADLIIETALRAREQYKGTGTPTCFCTTATLDTILLAQDLNGRRVYNNVADVAAALRCSSIVEVPVMANLSRTESDTEYLCDCIIVNLADYNVGADKGGAVSLFDDFDIDFNQQKYLIETRCSGALVHPKSAIVVEHTVAE